MYNFILSFVRNIMIFRKRLRAQFWSLFMTKVGKNVQISHEVYITGPRYITLNDNVTIGPRSEIIPYAKVAVGEDTQLGGHFSLIAGGEIQIGKNVLFGPGCSIFSFSHNYQDPHRPIMEQGTSSKGITIGDDVWLGANVVVLDGVTIGKGSVIGAGAVVTKDIPPYSVAAGVPAKVFKKRE
jgi:acetyltransferase-like isoleucine patch superfamily enzyme